ncbi:AAA family ATPase [Kineosporia sp. R_H_3]|uniref:AAA family ATPase n=1 Tax=Kineosporia sp. R_H_3 TaxID=1961848 RepID=UPI000B4BD4E5
MATRPSADAGSVASLGDADVVDLDAARRDSGTDAVLADLDADLVGLAPVKRRVAELAALLLVDRQRERFGLVRARPSLHMCFTGDPGTGKTTVALRVAELLHRLGHLRRGHVVTAGREDLVGQFVGHTGPRVRELVQRAMGGVLFVDEAYSLHRAGNERDYGAEAVEVLMQAMEEHRDDLVVVLAGYADRMEAFLACNPGLGSRVAHHVDFPPYAHGELVEIGRRILDAAGLQLSQECEPVFAQYVARRMEQPRFGNARSIRNAIDRARMRQARRLVDTGGTVGRTALQTLEPVDFATSRVLQDLAADDGAPGAVRRPSDARPPADPSRRPAPARG